MTFQRKLMVSGILLLGAMYVLSPTFTTHANASLRAVAASIARLVVYVKALALLTALANVDEKRKASCPRHGTQRLTLRSGSHTGSLLESVGVRSSADCRMPADAKLAVDEEGRHYYDDSVHSIRLLVALYRPLSQQR